jgi:hypothetical protein
MCTSTIVFLDPMFLYHSLGVRKHTTKRFFPLSHFIAFIPFDNVIEN